MMSINKRLLKCAEFISQGGVTADVGTDHRYLSAYLILNEISTHVYACDINEGPLNSARATVEKFMLSDKIDLILSDGLDNVNDENITDVVIAGMGGELITDIISRAQWLENGINLVLQPMTRPEVLRKWLYDNGFEILQEQAVTDENFTYSVIQAEYCGNKIEISDFKAYVGKLRNDTEENRRYLSNLASKLKKIGDGLSKSQDKNEQSQKYLLLSEKIKALAEE